MTTKHHPKAREAKHAKPKSVEEKVKAEDPHACVDERQEGKPREQQRRESRLEVARPKDTGRCGA